MLDFGHLPTPTGAADVQIFRTPVTVTSVQFGTVWHKPRGKTMLHIFCVGGGAGGGGGFTRAAAAAGGGGGGGGSSAVTRWFGPLHRLPDILYIEVGMGGKGVGSGGGVAGSGLHSRVLIWPRIANQHNVLVQSGNAAPTGGGTGTGAAVGAAGGAGAASLIADQMQSPIGTFMSHTGQVGFAGGATAGANGTATAISTSGGPITQGGSGGGGTTSANFAGGICTDLADSYVSFHRPAGSAAGTFDGSSGTQLWMPFFSFAGLGGGAANATAGGQGGDGAAGSGGGGGGAGTTGGTGGDGGDGIIIMTAW